MTGDPYKYFRVEARELLDGLTDGALKLEKGSEPAAVLSLLRLAHTLKGAARVVRQTGLADLAHGVEEVLSPFRDSGAAVSGDGAKQVLNLLDQMEAGLAGIDNPPAPATPSAPRTGGNEPHDTVRVEVEEVETMLTSLNQAATALRALQNESETIDRAGRLVGDLLSSVGNAGDTGMPGHSRIRPLSEELSASFDSLRRRLVSSTDAAQRELALAWESAGHLRLLPAESMFAGLLRTVRDATATLGKQAQLETHGGDIRLDAFMLSTLRDALLQLVRNAVAHGLENPDARRAAGKPAQGRVEIRIERRGERVAFLCVDDGSGIDLPAVRRAAVKKGLLAPGAVESFGMEDAVQAILRGGLTTVATPTGIAGRGIGLDLVREAVERLRGTVTMRTAAGAGTTVEICVPVSFTSRPALTVEADGLRASIPLDSVRRTLSVAQSEIARGATGEFIAVEGQAIPFIPLFRLLKSAGNTARRRWTAVVVADGADSMALGVDRLAGSGSVVVHTLPAIAEADPVIAGVIFDATGNPQLVLDPAGLARVPWKAPELPPPDRTPALPVLIVDDSLTTRMVEQSILESAGYEVESAPSAEEALGKARTKSYGLFLVDVEMPGMDGFEFIARTRQDPALRDIPAILVTSRSSAQDRMRGEEVGARAYVVKSEFDQRHFLQTIRRLITAA